METQILDGLWQLEAEDMGAARVYCSYFKDHDSLEIKIPGDAQSALYDSGVVGEPLEKDNWLSLRWVGETDWCVFRTFKIDEVKERSILVLSRVDTVSTVILNGTLVGKTENFFTRYLFDVTDILKKGENTLAFHFKGSEREAARRAKDRTEPFFTDVEKGGDKNAALIRRPLFQAGISGPVMETVGIHDSVSIVSSDVCFVKSWNCVPKRLDHNWICRVEVNAMVFKECDVDFNVSLAGRCEHTITHITPSQEDYGFTFTIPTEDVELWYPAGYGAQHLYPLSLAFGPYSNKRMVAFRTVEVRNTVKNGAEGPQFFVNDISIFVKGAVSTPSDILPSRASKTKYIKQLQAAAESGMNMIRVWGGGWYEEEDFYDECDRLGLMVWQDLMFASSVYPADSAFVANVKAELTYQIRRLKSHASIVLWCGGADIRSAILKGESGRDQERALITSYLLFQDIIKTIVVTLDPSRSYRATTPSNNNGELSISNTDGNGDCHFRGTSAGADFTPRFCSELGLPSFPSLSLFKSYVKEGEENITSPSAELHQSGKETSSIIVKKIAETFRFPSSKEGLFYLSQVTQARTLESTIKRWRSKSPQCSGILLWQLTDFWPCTSPSAIEFGGKKKALMYQLRNIFAPLSPFGIVENGILRVYVSNDLATLPEVKISVKFATFKGEKVKQQVFKRSLEANSVSEITATDVSQMKRSQTFCYLKVSTPEIYRESVVFLVAPKQAALMDPLLNVKIAKSGKNFQIEISCVHPAFFILLDAGDIPGAFSENFFSIRPTAQKSVTFIPEKAVSLEKFTEKLSVMDLYTASI